MRVLASFAPDALDGDAELSAIARFAAHLCSADVAAVTLVGNSSDRFLIHHGTDRQEIPREQAFCPHAMEGRDTLVVPDVAQELAGVDSKLRKFATDGGWKQGPPLLAKAEQFYGKDGVNDAGWHG